MSYFEILQRSVEALLRDVAYALPYWAVALLVFALALAAAGPARALTRRAVVRAKVVHQLEELFGRLAYLAVLVAGVVWALALVGAPGGARRRPGPDGAGHRPGGQAGARNLIADVVAVRTPVQRGRLSAIGTVGAVVDIDVRHALENAGRLRGASPNAQVYQSIVVNKTRCAAAADAGCAWARTTCWARCWRCARRCRRSAAWRPNRRSRRSSPGWRAAGRCWR
jgi:hypothetical protein